jgi:hypothetical protein
MRSNHPETPPVGAVGRDHRDDVAHRVSDHGHGSGSGGAPAPALGAPAFYFAVFITAPSVGELPALAQ